MYYELLLLSLGLFHSFKSLVFSMGVCQVNHTLPDGSRQRDDNTEEQRNEGL